MGMGNEVKEPLAISGTTLIATEVFLWIVGMMITSEPDVLVLILAATVSWLVYAGVYRRLNRHYHWVKQWVGFIGLIGGMVVFVLFFPIHSFLVDQLWTSGNFGTPPDSLRMTVHSDPQENKFITKIEIASRHNNLFGLAFGIDIDQPYEPESISYGSGNPNSIDSITFTSSDDFFRHKNQVEEQFFELDGILNVKTLVYNASPDKSFYISFVTNQAPTFTGCFIRGYFDGVGGDCKLE